MDDIKYLTIDHLSTKDLTRIFSKITVHDDVRFNGTPCWVWCSSRNYYGYGAIKRSGKNVSAHRLMYAWLVAPLPVGKQHGEIDHLCRIPQCCNPVHLEFVSSYENGMRSNSVPSGNAKKTHCKYGHPLSGHNVIKKNVSHRECRICTYRRIKEYNNRHPEVMENAVRKWQQNNKPHIALKARENYHKRKARSS